MTKSGGAFIFCRILAPPQCPPPLPRHHNINYLNDRERGAIIFIAFWRPPHAPPPQTPQYLTILMTERGRHYVCRILAPPMPPPPPTTPQYLTILMTEREGAIIFCRILAPPPQTSQYYFDDRERGGHLQYPVRSKYIRILLLIL